MSNNSNNELDLTIQAALRGLTVKQGERNQYLGQLRERIIRILSLAQVKSEKIYPEILTAIKDPRATHVLIHQSVSVKLGGRYEKPARARGLEVTYVSDPALVGATGLVVAADDAVDVEEVTVPESP